MMSAGRAASAGIDDKCGSRANSGSEKERGVVARGGRDAAAAVPFYKGNYVRHSQCCTVVVYWAWWGALPLSLVSARVLLCPGASRPRRLARRPARRLARRLAHCDYV